MCVCVFFLPLVVKRGEKNKGIQVDLRTCGTHGTHGKIGVLVLKRQERWWEVGHPRRPLARAKSDVCLSKNDGGERKSEQSEREKESQDENGGCTGQDTTADLTAGPPAGTAARRRPPQHTPTYVAAFRTRRALSGPKQTYGQAVDSAQHTRSPTHVDL